MKTATATLRSISPYSQSKFHQTPKLERELHDDYEKRTWRERMHYLEDGTIYIPPMAFANAIKQAAKYMNMKIPGAGKATFTKNFEAGVMVMEPLVIPYKKDDVEGEWLLVPSDGKRSSSGSRVLKCFCKIPKWKGDVTFYIFDDIITEDIFRKALDAAGMLIGIGRFRPRNYGYYGRFEVEAVKWIVQ